MMSPSDVALKAVYAIFFLIACIGYMVSAIVNERHRVRHTFMAIFDGALVMIEVYRLAEWFAIAVGGMG